MNLYDVLAEQGTTHFERLFSQRFAGGAVQTLTGQPPLSFKADGTPLISWSMKGNGEQQGTPTHDAPILPEFVGVRTGNLWDEDYTGISSSLKYKPIFVGDGTFTMSTTCPLASGNATIFLLSGNVSSGASTSTNGVSNTRSRSAESISGYVTIAYRFYGNTNPSDFDTILNAGTEPLPYEPYGYKIPLTCAGQTVPVYLGQTQTVREIRKLILTGTENWQTLWGVLSLGLQTAANTTIKTTTVISDRYSGKNNVTQTQGYPSNYGNYSTAFRDYASTLLIRDDTYGADTTAFKSYLADQYASGTPVTVWYVLAEPETTTVNEPLAKIGDYADELSSTDAGVTIPTAKGQNVLTVDTELQPSSMTITFK